MTQADEEFLKKLRAAFRVEADEHLQAIVSGLMELEKSGDAARRQEVVALMFREAHSLKGAARAINASTIELICQGLESVFAAWRKSEVVPSPGLLDPLHLAVNSATKLLTGLESGDKPDILSINPLLQQLKAIEAISRADATTAAPVATAKQQDREEEPVIAVIAESNAAPAPAAPSAGLGRNVSFDTIRIATAKLDAILLQAEEMLGLKLMANQRAMELKSVQEILFNWTRQSSRLSSELGAMRGALRASGGNGSSNVSAAAKILEFIDSGQTQFRSLEEKISNLVSVADHDRRSIALFAEALLESSKKLLMLPFATLLESFPKLVRDLSRDQGKEIELVIRGGDLEIDKRILEEMKDPLVHLLRNSIDHGIERPEARAKAHKPARGTITLAVSSVEGNRVEILVSDDGGGMNTSQLRAAAVKHGYLSREKAAELNEAEAIELAFRPELSTSRIITEISGRGLGLAIVKEKVQKLGGQIRVESRLGAGTSFHLQLPLTLATFRGILLAAAGQQFVVPTSSVERIARIVPAEIKTVENRETIRLDGIPVSLVRLGDVLGLPRPVERQVPAFVQVAVLNASGERIAFAVTEVMGEQEVLVKPLPSPLVRVKNVAGATILGSGAAVTILNVADLMKSAGNVATGPAVVPDETAGGAVKSILVVEDSITARMLLKNILESAGFNVKTAVDGLDAMTTLKTEAFDLVVSDVEMPRMSGFELTGKIRADHKLSELPVILVTALASKEDRERGIDVGANAYIVKSSFDQSDLLDVIRRFL